MENYIIELRNKDALALIQPEGAVLQDGFENGVWTTNLQEKLTLEEGDQLICRNSYIDTKAEAQQKIIIAEDTTLTMNFIYYANNWNGNKRQYAAPNWGTDVSSAKTPIDQIANVRIPISDGELYVACNKSATGSNFRFLKNITMQGVDIFDNVGGFGIALRYKDVNGAIAETIIELPKWYEVGSGTTKVIPVNITFDINKPADQSAPLVAFTTKFVNGRQIAEMQQPLQPPAAGQKGIFANTKIQPFTGEIALAGDLYTPAPASKSVVLPQGNYDPTELCEVVNGLFEIVGDDAPTLQNLNDNPLLISVGGRDENGDIPNAGLNNFIRIVDETTAVGELEYGFQYTTETGANAQAPNILGASQVELSFDPDTNRFNYNFLHTPCYANAAGNDGGDVEIAGLAAAKGWTQGNSGNPTPVLPTKRFRVGKNGGILLTGLQPRTFWSNQLGFDLDPFIKDQFGKDTNIPNPNCIIVNPLQKSHAANGAEYAVGSLSATVPVFSTLPKDGVQMTNGFIGISSIFNKGDKFQKQIGQKEPANDGSTESSLGVIGQTTNNIRAGDGLLAATSGATTFGYFLVEVQAAFGNNYINNNGNFKHIVAIVSRYYEKESYTSSTSADSIIYTHSGNPVIINSFNCRILNSDKSLAQNIGQDNTIILEVQKAPKQLKQIKK
jgi:hypothetical protein